MIDPTIQELYPFTSHYLDLDGVRMHYVDEGPRDAPPVVLLHGNPTWSFHYRDLIRALRRDLRVVAPDHVGCGLSDKPQRYPYTLATHVANIERLVDHLDLRGVTLGVHDWGGAIGMGWATRHPDRAARFIVFNSAAFFCRLAPLRIRACGWRFVGPLIVQGLNGFLRASFRMAVVHRERFTSRVRAGYTLPYADWPSRTAILRFIRDIPRDASVLSHAELARIEAGLARLADRPMLICWGARDFCFNDPVLAGWIRRFPDARFHRWEDAGHYVLEDAIERIIPLVREFLLNTSDGNEPRA